MFNYTFLTLCLLEMLDLKSTETSELLNIFTKLLDACGENVY